MNAYQFTAILALGGMLALSSCNKSLNIQPTDQISANTVFSTIGEANMGVLGVYSAWDEEYTIRIGSEVADECRIGLKNTGVGLTGAGQNLFRWAFTSADAEILAPWTNGYQVIDDANRVLAALPGVPAANSADSLEKRQLEGELLAIRAFAHFELYRVYAYSGGYNPSAPAVPYITGTDIYSQPSRPTTAVFFTQLKQDMAAAEPIIGSNGLYRMGLTALYALEARVALYTGDWATAIDRASRVIDAVPLATSTQFPAIWTDQGTSEEIFTLLRTTQSVIRPGDLWYNIPYGVYLFNPSKTLMQLYDTVNDVRYHSYFSTDSTLTGSGELPDVIVKYAGSAGAQNLNNLKVLRTGEQYLIRAEAYGRSGDLADGAADLNALRAARIAGYQPVAFGGLSDFLPALFTERYKELCFEGHRLYDLKRAGMDIVREPADMPAGASMNTLTPSSAYYYIPIPQAELLANPGMAPNNPGW